MANDKLLDIGHIVAQEQFEIKKSTFNLIKSKWANHLKLTETEQSINIKGLDFKIEFSKKEGFLNSYIINGLELMGSSLKPDFWRAPTDNDFGNKMQERCLVWKDVMKTSILRTLTKLQVLETQVKISTEIELPAVEGAILLDYLVHGNGQIDVSYSFKVEKKELPELPRIGMTLQLAKSLDNLKYYGRGPMENYIDRNTASFVGIYISKVFDQYFAYSRPQENGHKTDTRWLQLYNQSGMGLKIQAIDTPFEFNALPMSTSQLDPGLKKQLRTPLDVKEGNFNELHIDHKMMGVGGDNSWGAKPHDQYMYYADNAYTYKFSIEPKWF